jgi:biopolymer transport protein ExbD
MVKRTSRGRIVAIDSAAMASIGFFVLCFVLVTARPKAKIFESIEPPKSSSYNVDSMMEPIPIIISAGENKVYLSIDKAIRKQTLLSMARLYHVNFTDKQVNTFASIENFGVPMIQLKALLDNYDPDKLTRLQPGIPSESSKKSELFNWIRQSQEAYIQLTDRDYARVALNIDRKQTFPVVRNVIDNLQLQNINKISFITY